MSVSAPTEQSLQARFDQVGRWLLNRGFAAAYLMISRLGFPRFALIGTASVRATEDRVIFEFDPRFWDTLRLDELVGVLAHEAMHVLLRHVTGCRYRDPVRLRLWNFACDAVVNDTIAAAYPQIRLPGEPIRGRALVGHSCQDRSADDVLDELLDLVATDPTCAAALTELETLDCHEAWGEVGGTVTPLSDELEQSIDAVLQRTRMSDIKAGSLWGDAAARMQRRVERRASPIDPAVLLHTVIARAAVSTTRWVPPNPRLTSVYPKIVLPRWDVEGRPRLLLAIDASASIDVTWLSTFAAIAVAARAKATIEMVSFDTEIYSFDPSLRAVAGGGGTCFQVIEKHVEAMKFEPDRVVVLTDGFAARPVVRHPDRWLWLLTDDGTDRTIRGIGRTVRVRLGKPAQPTRMLG